MAKSFTRADRGVSTERSFGEQFSGRTSRHARPDTTSELLRLLEPACADESATDARRDLLATIHQQVIPQLLLAHAASNESAVVAKLPLPKGESAVPAFAQMVACEGLPSALAHVQSLVHGGASLETVLLGLVMPAARLLGEQWEGDVRSFTEVAIGLGTLQQVVQLVGATLAHAVGHRGFVLLVVAPCEEQTLGMYLLKQSLGIHLAAEFLRRAGWDVHIELRVSEPELVAIVKSQRVEMVGISVSDDGLREPVVRLVAALRDASRNPDIAVLLDGSHGLGGTALPLGATFCERPSDAVRWLEQHVRSPSEKRLG